MIITNFVNTVSKKRITCNSDESNEDSDKSGYVSDDISDDTLSDNSDGDSEYSDEEGGGNEYYSTIKELQKCIESENEDLNRVKVRNRNVASNRWSCFNDESIIDSTKENPLENDMKIIDHEKSNINVEFDIIL